MIDPQIPIQLGKELDRLRAENATLRGALADIAYSSDMTLKIARAKADRIYRTAKQETP